MVTVLIFSYNRHGYLRRAIDYWSQSDWSIIIADGSDMVLKCKFPSNIDYLHCPSASISDRLKQLVEKVTTPYVLLSADDDFIAFDGLRQTIEFLRHHSDYASAQGFYMRFQQDADSRIRWFWDYQYAARYVFDEDSLISRFTAAMSPPLMHYCYSVMQIKALKRTLALLQGVEETSVTTFELSFIAGLMACGKHATLPVFFGARQAQLQRWGNYVRFDDWVERNSVVGYAKWRGNICELFQEHALSRTEAERIVDESVTTYLRWVKTKHLSQQQLSKIGKPSSSTMLAQVMGKPTTELKVVLRPLYWSMRSWWHLYQMFGANVKAICVFRRDWVKIKSTILSHPLTDNNQ